MSIAVPKTYGHSTNGPDSVEGYNEGNASLLNNSEEPVPLELRPTPIPTQVSVMMSYTHVTTLILALATRPRN